LSSIANFPANDAYQCRANKTQTAAFAGSTRRRPVEPATSKLYTEKRENRCKKKNEKYNVYFKKKALHIKWGAAKLQCNSKTHFIFSPNGKHTHKKKLLWG
jgi:hypothetical protein